MEESDQNRQREEKKKDTGRKKTISIYYLVRWLLKNYPFLILDSSDFRIDPISGSNGSL